VDSTENGGDRVADGAIRLLAFEQLTPELQERFAPRVERLGYLGDFFRVAAHQPEALTAFVDFTEAGKDALPEEIVELVALTCATAMGNDYERTQHERLAVTLGLEPSWVAEVERLAPEEAAIAPIQRCVQRSALDALADHGRGAGPALRALVEAVGEPDAVAVMLVCGRYVAHALLVNSCGIVAPVPSIFEPADAEAGS
jgi:alkylhydroperoxidase family enzyme